MRLPAQTFAPLVLLGCATLHEAAGNRALKEGDTSKAIYEYQLAMAERPIMDFEFTRIQKRRAALVEGEWSPRLDAVLAEAARQSAVAQVAELLELRRAARAGVNTYAFAARVDAALLQAVAPAKLVAASPEAVPARVAELLDLVGTSLGTAAPQAVVDALVGDVAASLAVGFPAVPPGGGLVRLDALLSLRERLRGAGLPAATDAALDSELLRLQGATFPATTTETALGRIQAAVSLRARAVALGAPAPARELADRAVTDATTATLVLLDSTAATHRYLPLVDALVPLADADPRLRARLTSFAAEGAAWHTQAAAALPSSYRKLWELGLAAALDRASLPAASAEYAAHQADFTTSLGLSLADGGRCPVAAAAMAGGLGSGATPAAVTLEFTSCTLDQTEAMSERADSYPADEVYFVQENVQVGTQLERVQTGTHQEQCSHSASLEGYTWTGVCDVPDFENRQVPVFELQDVEHHRTVQRALAYTVRTRQVRLEVSGNAQLTWSDGSVVNTPFSAHFSDAADQFSYDLPGFGEARGTHHEASIPGALTVANHLPEVAAAAAGELKQGLTAEVRALRARLSRAEGVRAGGDAAGEAMVRSVLLGGAAEAEAASWLRENYGVDGRETLAVLTLQSTSGPAPAALPAAPYAPPPLVAPVDDFASRFSEVERQVGSVTTETYQKGIMPPNEIVDFHVGLSPFEVQTGATIASTPAPVAVGLEGHYALLDLFGHYGPAIHDGLGGRVALGMKFVGEHYTGSDEGPISGLLEAQYSLCPGLRFHYFGVFAGLSAGYIHAFSGDAQGFGWHLEPAVHVTARAFHTRNLVVDLSGFVLPIEGVPHKDRVALSVPAGVVDFQFAVEQTVLSGQKLAADGKSTVKLDEVPVQSASVMLGLRL